MEETEATIVTTSADTQLTSPLTSQPSAPSRMTRSEARVVGRRLRSELPELYITRGLTAREIGDLFGLGEGTVQAAIKEQQIAGVLPKKSSARRSPEEDDTSRSGEGPEDEIALASYRKRVAAAAAKIISQNPGLSKDQNAFAEAVANEVNTSDSNRISPEVINIALDALIFLGLVEKPKPETKYFQPNHGNPDSGRISPARARARADAAKYMRTNPLASNGNEPGQTDDPDTYNRRIIGEAVASEAYSIPILADQLGISAREVRRYIEEIREQRSGQNP